MIKLINYYFSETKYTGLGMIVLSFVSINNPKFGSKA
jgi:hypothetical protein